jgi:hypothetical protein
MRCTGRFHPLEELDRIEHTATGCGSSAIDELGLEVERVEPVAPEEL